MHKISPKIRSTSTFFKRRCCKCRIRKEVSYYNLVVIGGVMGKVFYCQNCGDIEIKKIQKEIETERIKQAEIDRLNYLKKEIKRIEIEQRAKELGINCPNE